MWWSLESCQSSVILRLHSLKSICFYRRNPWISTWNGRKSHVLTRNLASVAIWQHLIFLSVFCFVYVKRFSSWKFTLKMMCCDMATLGNSGLKLGWRWTISNSRKIHYSTRSAFLDPYRSIERHTAYWSERINFNRVEWLANDKISKCI